MIPRKPIALSIALLVAFAPVGGVAVPLTGTATAAADGDPTAGATEIDSCTVIDRPGTYALTEDITDSSEGICIDIRSSNVSFDGNGHLVEGNLTREGINETLDEAPPWPHTRVGVGVNVRTTERVENVTVENVTVSNWYQGVLSENVSGGSTSGVTAHDNGDGVTYGNSSNVTVRASNASNNLVLGISAGSSPGVPNADNRVVNNTAEGNGFFGVAVFLSNNSTIEDNALSENVFGIFAYGTSNSTFADNDAQNNSAVGLALEGDLEPTAEEPVDIAEPRVPDVNASQNNVVIGNDFSESGYIGIGLIGPSRTYIADNNVSNVPGTTPFPIGYPSSGLFFDNSSNNVVAGTDATGINGSGIALVNSSDDNLFVDNDASENAEDGISIDGSENVAVIGTTANDNCDDGIDIADSNRVVLLLNVLSGNGDRAVEVTNSENVVRLDSAEDLQRLIERLFQ